VPPQRKQISLDTDVAGARGVGIDAALIATGLTLIDETPVPSGVEPIGVLHDLALCPGTRGTRN